MGYIYDKHEDQCQLYKKPWEQQFQMTQERGDYIGEVCRDIESLGQIPTVKEVKRRVGAMATINEIEICMQQARRID